MPSQIITIKTEYLHHTEGNFRSHLQIVAINWESVITTNALDNSFSQICEMQEAY